MYPALNVLTFKHKNLKSLSGSIGAVIVLVEEYAGTHAGEEQSDTAGDSLHSSEHALGGPSKHREPDVAVRQVFPCLRPEQVREVNEISACGCWNYPVNLQPNIIVYYSSADATL